MENEQAVRAELRGPTLALREEIPEVLRAYGELSRTAMANGELTALTKEFAALAIAIAKECDGCIVAHVRNVVRLGATRHQVAELIGVAVMMNGGPGLVWGPRALAAFDQVVVESLPGSGSPKT